MKNFITHTRDYILRGLIAIIPILLCIFSVQMLYVLIDKRVIKFLGNFFEVRYFPGLGILLVLACLYLIGLIVSNIVGRQFLKFIEKISERIPFIKSVYSIGKQVSSGFSADKGKQAFKKAVLVKLDGSGLMTPGFVVSSMKSNKENEEFCFVFIPTAPTPAGGFICVVKSSQIIDPGWTVEECLKMVISVGIVVPDKTLDI